MPYRHTHDTALHKRTRRNKLAIAALHLFARYSYHATSVRMITKGAHTSVGTFYAYFRAKDDLVAFVFQLFAETSARVLRAAISSTNAAPAQQLHAATRDLVLLLTLNPDIARILIAQSSGLDARLEKLRRGVIANHAQFFEQLLAKYEPTPSDCSVAARCWPRLRLRERPSLARVASRPAPHAADSCRYHRQLHLTRHLTWPCCAAAATHLYDVSERREYF